MTKGILSLLIYLFAALLPAQAQTINDLSLMSEDFPPYNFVANGELTGSSVDLMVRILQELHSTLTRSDIQILPWARSYLLLQKQPNAVLFATTRTENREKLFKWVGPISTARNVIIGKKSRHFLIHGPNDLAGFQIGVVENDAGQQLLDQLGMPKDHEDVADSGELNVRKLINDRFDLIAYDENVVRWILKNEGQNPEDYETVYLLGEGQHYFAFNKGVPDEVIKAFQKTLDELKRTGTFQKILDQYLGQ